MAFNLNYWGRVQVADNSTFTIDYAAGTATSQGAQQIYTYNGKSNGEALATIAAADYFIPVVGSLQLNDLIYISATDDKAIYVVSSITYPGNGGSGAAISISELMQGADGDVVGPSSATDNALARFDGATGKLIQNSVAILSDAGVLSGLIQLDVDNLRLDGNTLSSTDTNGDINLTPDGAGNVVLTNNLEVGDGKGILDANGNEQLLFAQTAGAVNYLEISNSATGNGVSMAAMGSDANIDFTITAKGTGNVLFDGSNVICGDPGTEGSGIDVSGTTYNSILKVSDLGGSNQAQFIMHRHSTTIPAVIVGARSNSDDSSHGVVSNGQRFLRIIGVGWDGADYAIGAAIDMAVDGAPGANDMPGRIVFSTTPDGSQAPVERMRIDNAGMMSLNSSAATVDTILDEDNMASDDPNALATQQSIKAYVDNSLAGTVAYQQVVSLQQIMLINAGIWTMTRLARGDYALVKTAADDTSIIAFDITPQLVTAASKGFRLDSFDVNYSIATLALDAHTVTLDAITYANNSANAVSSVAITGVLATAIQANPYVTNVSVNSPAFLVSANSKYVIELTVDAAATSAYTLYGLNLHFTKTIS